MEEKKEALVNEETVTNEKATSASEQELAQKIVELEKELQEYREIYLRTRADFENFRKRIQQQLASSIEFGKRQLIEKILPVIDNLERAIKVDEKDGESLKKGLEIVYRQLMCILLEEGLEPIEVTDKKFDPAICEAVSRVETKEYDDEFILGEEQKGYLFKKELLRPARVIVACHPEEEKEENTNES